MPASGGRVLRRADGVRDKSMDSIQKLRDRKVARAELVRDAKGQPATEGSVNCSVVQERCAAASAGRSVGDRAGQAAPLTSPGSEINDSAWPQLAGPGLTR
jgi:hypothetical protein